ncbi:hypothetical protein [Roseateles sp. BYS87W]|uniref:Tetratricopeptide repeat protein n=1 Tax=Pelomonas baiyunensis TaxID=3299026 RepID=A0ABW7H511_9BURK
MAAAALLTACASVPPPPPPAPPPPRPTLTELMKDAQDAAQAGAKDKSRAQLTTAAKAYPVQKEPWVKLAEDYFETADYGNAILAAQEVVQRDPVDRTAHSILAVAGLRVASTSLLALREQQSGMPTDTQSEARNLTKALRETLGEPLLVPPVTPPPAPAPRKPTGARAAAPASTPSGAPKPAGAATAGAPAVVPPSGAPASPAQAAAAGSAASSASSANLAGKPVAKPLAAGTDKPANPFDRLR